MKNIRSFLLILLVLNSSCRVAKKVCFTFDDLPVAGVSSQDSVAYVYVFNEIVNQLKHNKVPAIGFINEIGLFQNDTLVQYKYDLLKHWSDEGLQLGNHTYSHKSYHEYSFNEYTEDILKGEKVTQKLISKKGKKKYFRHPFLHIGDSKSRADSLTAFLREHNYLAAPVTIDNDDYIFSAAYFKALLHNDTIMATKIKMNYLSYMEQKLVYFEKQSQRLFERNINQILLLHNNILNAHALTDLIAIYKKYKYHFVSLDEAMKDSAYKTEISVFKNWGISWLDRWALSKKVAKDFFKDEPETPSYLTDYINNEH